MGISVVTPNVENVVIRNNAVVSQVGVAKRLAYASAVTGAITADHNVVFGPSACPGEYAGCVDLASHPGNVVADPLFVAPDVGDVHLAPGSPAIDAGAGIPGLTTDRDGEPRPQGAAIDVGAFEDG